jgi:acyl-homoserine lactone acylase PvdQ
MGASSIGKKALIALAIPLLAPLLILLFIQAPSRRTWSDAKASASDVPPRRTRAGRSTADTVLIAIMQA